MDIKEISDLYQAGDLSAAKAAAVSFVRDNPEDHQGRSLLMQLYLFLGERDKAQNQIKIIESQVKDNLPSYMTLQLINQVINADKQRDQFFDAPTEAPCLYPEDIAHVEQVMPLLRKELSSEMEVEALVNQRPVFSVKCEIEDNEIIGEMLEPDDLLAFCCEIYTAKGEYKWLAWENIQRLELHPIEKPLDLIYRPATITRTVDPEAPALNVYIPARYLGSSAADAQTALARSTEWVTCTSGAVSGLGQKCLVIGDDLIPLQQISAVERFATS